MAWLALGAGLALTLLGDQILGRYGESMADSRFAARSAEVHAAIQSRLVAYAQVLRGAQAYVGAIGHPGKTDWAKLYPTLRIAENYPGITGLVYIRAFPGALYERELAAIREFEPGFRLRPEGAGRDFYAVVTHVEPRTPSNLPVIGSDSWTHPARRETLEAVRDSGENRITPKVNLVIDDPAKPQPAFLMYQAVYRQGMIPATVEARRENLLGFITAGFRIGPLMQGTLGEQPDDIALRVYDGDTPRADNLFHASHPDALFAQAAFHREMKIAVGGRTWSLQYASLPAFEADVAGRGQRLALIGGGLLVSLLLFLVLWTLASTHRRARTMAAQMTRSLRASETKLRTLFAQAPLGVWLLDAEGTTLDCNEKIAEFAGASRETLIGLNVLRDARDPALIEPFKRALLGETVSFETPYTSTVGGRSSVYHFHFRPIHLEDQPRLILGFVEDISARKLAEAHIEHLAHHDTLTGLANRALLADRAQQAILHASRTGTEVALCFIDLDFFKHINDSVGHAVGDEVLLEIARRLHACVRASDTLARIGGDEFVMLLTDLHQAEAAAKVIESAIDTVAQPISLSAGEFSVTASIGIATWPRDGDTVDVLMRNADVAMYHAKSSGRNNFQFFTDQMNAYTHAQLALENDLRQAIRDEQFVLHYQPQVDAETGRIIGAEALIRWPHPTQGLIPPGLFIPLAEEKGLIDRIGQWVLFAACRQMRAWQDAGLPAIPVAVNISPLQLKKGDLPQLVRAALAGSGLAPELLTLELTESAIMDDVDKAIALMGELKRAGVSLEIDDFGTGYSSLSYLKRLPIHRLKVDQSFVRDLPRDQDNVAIVSAILSLAANLTLATIAEGVETPEQMAFLKGEGCLAMQGYWFSQPLPAEAFEALLRYGEIQPASPATAA